MPEENFASSEHELIQEITAPFTAVSADPEADPGEADFPVVLRGYDRLAVDAYVRRAREIISDLRATSSPEAAVRRALERVGGEVAGILQRAHETADKITSHSRAEAEGRLEAARGEAAELKAEAERELERAHQDAVKIRAQAERNLTELDAETDRIWAERHRIVEDTRELSRQMLALADSAAERFPPAEEDRALEDETQATVAMAADGDLFDAEVAEPEEPETLDPDTAEELDPEATQVLEPDAAAAPEPESVPPPHAAPSSQPPPGTEPPGG